MTNTQIYSTIQQITGFSDNEIQIALSRFEEKKLKKKTTLLSAGQISQELYFIINGCMRLFYEKDGNDISAYFFTENMFAGAYDSFTSQQKSRHSIETIEDCHVLSINYKNLQQLYKDVPKMNEVARKILEERFFDLHKLYTSFILDSPEERYLNLIKERPELLQRIPQHQIASFLGVTPVSLSRIRNRVLKNS